MHGLKRSWRIRWSTPGCGLLHRYRNKERFHPGCPAIHPNNREIENLPKCTCAACWIPSPATPPSQCFWLQKPASHPKAGGCCGAANFQAIPSSFQQAWPFQIPPLSMAIDNIGIEEILSRQQALAWNAGWHQPHWSKPKPAICRTHRMPCLIPRKWHPESAASVRQGRNGSLAQG